VITLRAAAGAVMAREWAVPPETMADLRALVDEALRIADLLDGAGILAVYALGTGRRQRAHVAVDLYPGDIVVSIDDWRQESET
jgi:hypothetical protein